MTKPQTNTQYLSCALTLYLTSKRYNANRLEKQVVKNSVILKKKLGKFLTVEKDKI